MTVNPGYDPVINLGNNLMFESYNKAFKGIQCIEC